MGFLLNIHSLLRWVVVLLGLYVLINSLVNWKKNKNSSQDKSLYTMFVGSMDLQFLIGLVLYFAGSMGYNLFKVAGFMKSSLTRFFAVEHLLGMLLALILIHIGKAKYNKIQDASSKNKAMFFYTLIAFIIILASIPWPFREVGIGRNWF